MSEICRICLGDVEAEGSYHTRCLKALFGVPRAPRIEIDLAKLHTAALAMVGHTSISGVQRKVSVSLATDRMTLQVAAEGGRYILKPAGEAFPHLPENEHLTMRLAELAGIEVPPCGLVRLADGSAAYVVARFDRPSRGGKLRQEDFCQLAEKSPKQKYEGSAEQCARLVRRYASEPLVELLRLYRLLVFTWWTGNGDMHLKNFSLLAERDGLHRLSPAYDLISTRLVIPEDPLALPVCGQRDGLTRGTWLQFADYCKIPRAAAERVIRGIVGAEPAAGDLVRRSALPAEMKGSYQKLLGDRTATLADRRPPP